MSSFKRKNNTITPKLSAGTKLSPANSSIILTSSGIPSLDDVLGGGIQLGTDILLLNPDVHSAHTDLLQKYFIAQGLSCGHKVHVFDVDLESLGSLVESCMWIPGTSAVRSTEEEETPSSDGDKVKIAWRYENMQKFRTTVTSRESDQDDYCQPFDLSTRIPSDILHELKNSGRLCLEELVDEVGNDIHQSALERIETILSSAYPSSAQNQVVTRICIPNFSSSYWGDPIQERIMRFLFRLRAIVRKYPYACASISLPPYLSTDNGNSEGWVEKLAWASDACITLNSSSADPSTSALYPSHHGLLKIHRLPCVQTLVPASDRFSSLRGLSTPSTSISSGGASENNLAFKCTRKRFVIETFHLDIEGGVGERRTTPATTNTASERGQVEHTHHHTNEPQDSVIAIEVETDRGLKKVNNLEAGKVPIAPAEDKTAIKKKPKKRVGFQIERPDLYDF